MVTINILDIHVGNGRSHWLPTRIQEKWWPLRINQSKTWIVFLQNYTKIQGSSFVGSYFNANKLNLLWMDICCSIQFASMVLQYVLWYFTFHQCSPEANLYILYLMLNTVPWIKYIGTCIILVFYQCLSKFISYDNPSKPKINLRLTHLPTGFTQKLNNWIDHLYCMSYAKYVCSFSWKIKKK